MKMTNLEKAQYLQDRSVESDFNLSTKDFEHVKLSLDAFLSYAQMSKERRKLCIEIALERAKTEAFLVS